MISGAAQKLPCEGHDFGTFRDATIVLMTQTATEGSIWVVEEGPNHLGWRALVDDRGLQLRSGRKSDIISGTTGNTADLRWIDPPQRLVFGPNHPFVVSFRC